MSALWKFCLAAVLFCGVMVHGSSVCSASLPDSMLRPDRLTLKDGKVIEGTITKEVDGWIWFTQLVSGIEVKQVYKPEDIQKIERDATPVDAKPDEVAPKPESKGLRAGGAPRAAVLTMEGTVGIQMSAKPIKDAIPLLEKDNIDVVVLKINSGGGLLLEIQRLSDVIHKEYKGKFRTVAWIESAISAAAMTAHTLEEIYFLPQGNYGGCTGFSGALNAVKGRGLEEVLIMMEKISDRGGHPRQIMRAMQISGDPNVMQELQIAPPSGELSADIDENGDVTWYQNQAGKFILNPKGGVKILTFNAGEAQKFKFSRGTAANVDELAHAMGYQEIEWVGTRNPLYGYPVSNAEELQLKWRKEITDAEQNFGRYFENYQRAVQTAAAAPPEDRGPWISKARDALNRLRQIAKNFPNFQLLRGLEDEWFEEQDELLKRLARR